MELPCCMTCDCGPHPVDKLEEIVRMQMKLMDRLSVPRMVSMVSMGKLTPLVQKTIPTYMFALICELGEIGDAINWKPWKKTEREIDVDNLRMEFIDALHFLLEMMIMVGMDAKMIYNEYKKKNYENNARQDRGY